MGRPSKVRKVGKIPKCREFIPEIQDEQNGQSIIMTIDEYETLRLIDYLGFTQDECAVSMDVARTTVQAIYQDARRKMARFVIEGCRLKIEGGEYTLLESNKESKKMKIAVTYENGQVFQHFGHTEQFKIYDIEDSKIISSRILDTNGSGHGALAGLLGSEKIDTLICGGIGGGARMALADAGITLYPGAEGDADAQVESFLKGNLNYDPDTVCHHHDGEEQHSCGDHGCSSSSCGNH